MQIIKQSVGIDVSKDTLELCMSYLDINLYIQTIYTTTLSNTDKGVDQLLELIERYCEPSLEIHCIMEATGVYHERVAHRLYEQGAGVYIILPSKAKAFVKSINQRTKTDKIDARLLAQLGLERTLEAWQPATHFSTFGFCRNTNPTQKNQKS